ncbi:MULTISPECIES: ATP-binding protein [unclassified Fusibacter]|uniref:ATP-binding protein n=1 Tax=unclassified Fusibacter TaxID=2624464 RepID=UPI0010110ED2|nr:MULTISPECIES: ATP-binding protein [unclassified Fusibacter]MCK8060461.1 ATP-binding protein [Fusibacter sp. A2]NPE20250.1 hypothetical protein [Fusibacter sp. A1]RXV63457.1 hypothetical protein DWB64_00360 [Fusibacter sp. A1]
MTFRLRITLAMIATSVIIILTIGWVAIYLSKDTIEHRTQEFLSTALVNHATDINQLILAAEKAADSITDEVLITMDPYRFKTDEEYRQRYLKNIESAVRLSAEITTSHSTFAIFITDDQSYTIWYADKNKDGLPERIITEDLLDRIAVPELVLFNWTDNEKQWMITDYTADYFTVVKPLIIGDTLVGFTGGDVSNDHIKILLRKVTFINSSKSWVQLHDGTLVSYPKGAPSAYRIDTGSISSLDTALPDFYKMQTLLVGALGLSNDWQLIMTVELDDVYRGLSRIYYIISVIMVVALVLSVVTSTIVARRIAEPYSYLASAIEFVGTEKPDVHIDDRYIKRVDEAGTLSRAIDSLLKRQRENYDTIRSINLDLEQKIEERTRQLVRSNKQLEKALNETHDKQDALIKTNAKLEASLKEIVKTKQQLISSEKIASLTHVLIGFSHNMNTPLGNALTLITFLQKKGKQIKSEYDQGTLSRKMLMEFIDDLNESTALILKNINDTKNYVCRFEELSTSRALPISESANLKELIYRQFEAVKQRHSTQTCSITVESDADLDRTFDTGSFEKLVYELIENSFTHGFDSILHPMIAFSITEDASDPSYLTIKYKDNGVGVPIDKISNLFTPLYTTKLTTHDGLGLNMLHNIVTQAFDGTIEVDVSREYGLSYLIRLNLDPTHRKENENEHKKD